MPAVRRQLIGFAPDLDPLTPGVIVDGSEFVPTEKGFRTLPNRKLVFVLAGPVVGAAFLKFSDGQGVVVVGTKFPGAGGNTELAVYQGNNTWLVQALGAAPVTNWRFAIYQDLIIAVDGCRPPWVADRASLATATPWSPLGGNPPVASHVAASDFSLFLVGETAPATVPVVTARWWSTKNPVLWTPDVATQTVTDAIDQTSGPITALLALRSTMILYKANSLFIASITGPPDIWDVTEVSRQVGTPVQEAVVSAHDSHYFLGPDDFYRFDGFSVNPNPNDLREWFFDRVDAIGIANVAARFDEARSVVFWHYSTKDNPIAPRRNEWVALNIRTQKWANGRVREGEGVSAVIQDPITSLYPGATPIRPAASGGIVFIPSEQGEFLFLYEANGDRDPTTDLFPLPAYLITGDLGDRTHLYQCTDVRPGYTIKNGTPTLTFLSTYQSGDVYTIGTLIALTADGWFHAMNTARLQRLRFGADRDVELADFQTTLDEAGEV